MVLPLNAAFSSVLARPSKLCVILERSPVFEARQTVIPFWSGSSSMPTAMTRSMSSVEAEMNAKLSASCLSRSRVSCRALSWQPLKLLLKMLSFGRSGVSVSVHRSVMFSTKRFWVVWTMERFDISYSGSSNIECWVGFSAIDAGGGNVVLIICTWKAWTITSCVQSQLHSLINHL